MSSEIRQLTEQKQLLLAAKERGSGALEQLSHMENLSVSLDDIFASKYLQVRFGRLPSDSYQKLKYYDDRLFFFQPLSEEGEFVWGFCFTDKIHVAEVDEILSSSSLSGCGSRNMSTVYRDRPLNTCAVPWRKPIVSWRQPMP